MKLISLNTWGGRIDVPFKEFLKQHAKDTDIFCFQEVNNGALPNEIDPEERSDLFKEMQAILSDFVGHFTPQVPRVGVAVFVRKTIPVRIDSSVILSQEEVGHLKLMDGSTYYPRIMQSVSIVNMPLTVYNFHGIPGNLKQDTPERELQTKRLQEILDKSVTSKILVGDFNLSPNTKAVSALEKTMTNLVMTKGFKTTRTKYYDKLSSMPFADYTFVSPDLKIKHFEVLKDEISDHSAMFLEIA